MPRKLKVVKAIQIQIIISHQFLLKAFLQFPGAVKQGLPHLKI